MGEERGGGGVGGEGGRGGAHARERAGVEGWEEGRLVVRAGPRLRSPQARKMAAQAALRVVCSAERAAGAGCRRGRRRPRAAAAPHSRAAAHPATQPRYEFRAFRVCSSEPNPSSGPPPPPVAAVVAAAESSLAEEIERQGATAAAGHGVPRCTRETYIFGNFRTDYNVKVRGGTIDIKQRLSGGEDEGGYVHPFGIQSLELWEPFGVVAFPAAGATLQNVFERCLGVTAPDSLLGSGEYRQSDFMEMIASHPLLHAIDVRKERVVGALSDSSDGTLAEVSAVTVEDYYHCKDQSQPPMELSTVCVEAVDPDEVLRAASAAGLEYVENTNYIAALQRVLAGLPPTFMRSDDSAGESEAEQQVDDVMDDVPPPPSRRRTIAAMAATATGGSRLLH